MHLFMWDRVDRLTTSYHDGGGLVVFAESLDAARAQMTTLPGDCEARTKEPTLVTLAPEATPGVWVFPDAGCC